MPPGCGSFRRSRAAGTWPGGGPARPARPSRRSRTTGTGTVPAPAGHRLGTTTTMEHRRGQNHHDGASPWLRSPLPEPERGPGAPPAPPSPRPRRPLQIRDPGAHPRSATQAPTPEELRFYDVNRQLRQAVQEGAVPVGKRVGRNRPAVSRVISKAPGQRQHADARPPLAPRAPQLAAGKINHAKRGRRAPRPRLLAGPGPAIGPRSSVRGGPSSCGP
jgi:hypothetical protein